MPKFTVELDALENGKPVFGGEVALEHEDGEHFAILSTGSNYGGQLSAAQLEELKDAVDTVLARMRDA